MPAKVYNRSSLVGEWPLFPKFSGPSGYIPDRQLSREGGGRAISPVDWPDCPPLRAVASGATRLDTHITRVRPTGMVPTSSVVRLWLGCFQEKGRTKRVTRLPDSVLGGSALASHHTPVSLGLIAPISRFGAANGPCWPLVVSGRRLLLESWMIATGGCPRR